MPTLCDACEGVAKKGMTAIAFVCEDPGIGTRGSEASR